jgi:REP element-mobilizing transposase RayT
MPRQSRVDAPGALHHIICRGIERRQIFEDDSDRNNFIERFSGILSNTATPCYAWALIPNHFHLLIRTGNVPVATVMRRLLTGYAVSFNRRHNRHGHLFQNRYKSILCQENLYLLELVRYIHLNPLRAGIVSDLNELDRFAYSGHSRLMGKAKGKWQDADRVLGLFAKNRTQARKHYKEFVQKGVLEGKKLELTGGGLIRSVGGWSALESLRRMNVHFKSDERVLGDSDFVDTVLKTAGEAMERKYRLKAKGYDFDTVLERVGEVFGIPVTEVLKAGKQPERVKARSVLAYWAVRELGLPGTTVGERLGLSQSATSRAVQRNERIAAQYQLALEIDENA